MKIWCEYCQHYEEDYEINCRSCRVGSGEVDYSNFEFNYEIKELMDKAEKWDEKETPKKVKLLYSNGRGIKHYTCLCNAIAEEGERYCWSCGQRLDWRSEEE